MRTSRTATATVLGAIVSGLCWLGTTAPRAHSATLPTTVLTERSPEVAECPTRIGAFKQTDVWYRGKNRLLIEADSACGSRYGDALDLHGVRLAIESGGRTYAILRSSIGTYDTVGHSLLIGPTRRETDQGCLRGVTSLLIDLKTGELRTPGHRLILANAEELPSCPTEKEEKR